MKNLRLRPLAGAVALILGASLALANGFAGTREPAGNQPEPGLVRPGNVKPSPITATPGSLVSITVTLDRATDVDQIVSLQASDPTSFASFPSNVLVPAGSSSGTAIAEVSANAPTGTVTIGASCNGGMSTGFLTIVPPGGSGAG